MATGMSRPGGSRLQLTPVEPVIRALESAGILDGPGNAVGFGVLSYGPTALTGVSDYADSEAYNPRARRTGLVHAATNATALTLY
jgi:hypothetical protein